MEKSATTYQEQAYQYIRDQILNLTLKPGEYVTDTGIANQLKISRTPVREAFYRLEKEELLVYETRRGWKVYSLSLKDIQEIFDLKETIEGLVARQAAACEDESLQTQLKEVFDQMKIASEMNNADAWLQADSKMHEIMFKMANNNRAQKIIKNLNDQWHRVRIGFTTLKGRQQRSILEHQEIVERILAGDGDGAERKMREHLHKVREELVNVLVNLVLPFVDEGV